VKGPRLYWWNVGAGGCSRLQIDGDTAVLVEEKTVECRFDADTHFDWATPLSRDEAVDMLRELRAERIEVLRLV